MSDDEDLEARLARWQPADVPPGFLRRLRAAEPPGRTARWSWPLAYAGLSVAWAVIFALWLATPYRTDSPGGTSFAQTAAGPPTTPAPANALAMERAYYRSHHPEQL